MKISKAALLILSAMPAALLLAGCSDSDSPFPAPQADVVAKLREGGATEGEATETEAAPTGTGWATITGTFTLDGDPPAPKLLATGGKDAPTCRPEGIPDDSFLVDKTTKGIANVLIFARKVSRVNESYAANESAPATFDQKNCMFVSHVKPVLVSQPVVLTNSDAVAHNTAMSPPADKAANPLLPSGKTEEYKFSRPQNTPVPVSCSIHPWMKAYIIPRDNPYFAVTGPEGKFEIQNVPAGEEVEFQLWQEVAGGPQGALVIPGVTDSKGRLVKTLTDGETLDLGTVAIPAAAFKL